MSKEQIANEYLLATKARYLNNDAESAPFTPAAIVVGSRPGNIGAAIAQKLRETVTTVEEYDKASWSPAYIRNGKHNILILANGRTHLDWIENQPNAEVIEVIHDCLTESIMATKLFVGASLNIKAPKYIVYVGSMAYRSVLNASSVYCAAKAGLAHFARCMAWELAPKNYNVFIVHPSNTEGTPMTEETIEGLKRFRGISRADAEAYWGANLPRQNWLQPGDVAETVAFLVSGKADYLSGSQLELAGGQR